MHAQHAHCMPTKPDYMSTPDDIHFSDVHLRTPGSAQAAEATSSFAYATDPAELEVDGDGDGGGDQVVKRRRAAGGTLRLQHALATPLPDVGLQVWRGALLLCDYILARPALLRGATVLELGAGCGLSGLLAATTDLGARRVFLTDCVESVLINAQTNVELNGVGAVARVRWLDWAAPSPPWAWAEPAPKGPFAWRDDERAELRGCTLILAADCVYCNDQTDALVACLNMLLRSLPGSVALVAMELRMNFSLSSMAVRAPAVDHFACGLEVAGLDFQRVSTRSFAQRFTYERVKELELWRVTVSNSDSDADSETADGTR